MVGLLVWKIDLIIDEHGVGGTNCKVIPILEDDSFFSASITHIHFCLGKGTGLRLIAKPSICSFHITHFIFTSMLCCYCGLIQPLTFNLFTCECEHGLNTFGTHPRCPFGGQHITTHDTIRNFMYVIIWESGHDVWKELWYVFMLGLLIRIDLYMTREV
jgi:hypothetical protein